MSRSLTRFPPATLFKYAAAGAVSIGVFSRLMSTTVHADSGARPKTFGKGPAFVSLQLESSEAVSHNTKRLRFKLPDPEAVSGLSLTSALLTVSWPKGRWFPVARPYTPISPLDQPGSIDLLVKQYPNGKQSTHLHSLQPGDKLLFAAAIPGHAWKPTPPTSGPQRHVTLIAGGLGITPMFQLAQGILRNPSDATGLTLVVGANTDRDVLLKEELDRFEAAFPGRFRAVYTVSKPDEGSPFRKGYVDKALLEGVLPKPTEGASKDVFVCGPPAMEASLTGRGGVLEQLGFQKGRVHVF